MKKKSRRKFIKTCFYLTIYGLGSAFTSLFSGCREKENSTSLFNKPDDKKKEPLTYKENANIDPDFEPAYLRLHRSGELKKRGEELWDTMKSCKLCPRKCGINKLDGNKGFCQASSQLEISSYHPHFGEEKPLVGRGGSGTIFLANCGLRCVFCINWEISQGGRGEHKSIEDMAKMMLNLQQIGCHNINFVTPTHYSPHIILAVDIAADKGLRLPLVYNTCGWECLEILKKLNGIIDIYLPDFKYFDGKMAAKYSAEAETYPEITKIALLEMHRQVGIAKPADDGLIYRGLMVRHLVMPNGVSGSKEVIEWIAKNLPKDTYLNIMSQYRPMYKAIAYPEISRRISRKEYYEACRWAKEAGLTNLDIQGYLF
ncbi:MAG: radical SAM protein [Thermodesulfobacteriota bacterium]|nr:radical SAM protein [Thermodesulfobacteriota bacterium]